MSVATSIPCIKLPSSTTTSSSSSSPCSSYTIRLSSHYSHSYYKKPSSSSSSSSCLSYTIIRSSQTEGGPIRRPSAPSVPAPAPPLQQPQPPTPPPSSSAQPMPVPVPKPAATEDSNNKSKSAVTLEFQRAKAKELQDYFKQKKLEEADQGPAFGFVPKNEIGNGRWAMFGFAVGMLTEYATGSDFVEQVKLMLSNLGIVDLD